MVRRHADAAATMLLAVCVTTVFAGRSPERGVQSVSGVVGIGSAAGGRAHTLLATPDGRVFSWGAGGRGQIGDGALSDRWSPVVVAGLEDVTALAAGAVHSVALTTAGEVYAWGANASGRLGDGTRIRRPRPVRVSGLTGVRSIAAGRAHTLAVTMDGRVFAWGANDVGQLGIGNTTPSWVPTQITGLPDIVAVAAGDSHSLAIARDGRLFAWGGNSLSAIGDGTTTDRLRPVAVGLVDVAAVAAGAEHSLALLRSGAVYSWGRGANGELGTGSTQPASTPRRIPDVDATAIAAGRHFSAAIRRDQHVITWGANAAGQLGDGTTTRRLRPVVVNGLDSVMTLALGDAHGIAVSASGDVRTWGEGTFGRLGLGSEFGQSVPSEIPGDVLDWDGGDGEPVDTIAPSIVASTSPALHAGWMTAPVTVTFTCSDDVGVASCSAPVTIARDGYAQEVVGTAVDRAGNRSSTSLVINMDLSPPTLSISQPLDAVVVEGPQVVVLGGAHDLGSGVADARCNGEPAELTDAAVRCAVQLQPGRNDIVLQAIDAVGHSASVAVTVTRAGVATRISLTPATRASTVSEVIAFSLRDEFGVAVDRAQWSTSDESVVTLSGDDPPIVTAVGIGEAAVTAQRDGLTSTASIVVSAAMQAGAVRWTLPSLPDVTTGQPLFANRVDASSPHLFTVESGRWGEATLRAVTSEGEVLWQLHSPGVPLMGDAFGGVLAGVFDANEDYQAYVRLGGGSIRPWRFESVGWLDRPAQSSEGTIYAIEHLRGGLNPDGKEVWDKYTIAIDGATGQLIRRTLMTREIEQFTSNYDGLVLPEPPPPQCHSKRYEYAPEMWGPFAGTDDRGYFLVRRHQLLQRGNCLVVATRPDRTISMGLDLVIVSPTGETQTTNIFSADCTGTFGTTLPCDLPVKAAQIMPDGIGGTLVTWERGTHMVGQAVFVQRSLTTVDAENNVVEHPVGRQFWLELVGQAGIAVTFDEGWQEMDVRTGDIKWTDPLPNLAILAARPDGGLATLDVTTGELKLTDAGGAVERTQPFGLDWYAVHQFGDWIGLRGNALSAVVGDFSDATRWATLKGNAQGQLTVRRPGMGILLKSQQAKPPFPIYHTAIQIAPINQKWIADWYQDHPSFTPKRDLFDNLFITLGAGLPDGSDTASNCFIPGLEPLVSDTNRDGDVNKPAARWTQLPVSESAEAAAIGRLLDWHSRYTDNAPYACFPEDLVGFFNSNSYVRSLLTYAQVSHDGLRQPKNPSPGWKTILPENYFRPQ